MPIVTRAGLVSQPTRIKPRGELEINRTHPLAQGLNACFALNEVNGTQYDLTGQFAAKVTVASQGFTVRAEGMSLVGDGTGNAATVSKSMVPTGATGFRPFTIAAVARLTATAQQAVVSVMRATSGSNDYALIWWQGGGWQYEVNFTATTTSRNVTHGSLTLGKIYTFVGVSYSNVQTRLYVDGSHGGVTATGTMGNIAPSWDTTALGSWISVSAHSLRLNGNLFIAASWNRALRENEIRSFSANPYQFLRPRRKARMWTGAASGASTIVDVSASLVLAAADSLTAQKNMTASLVLPATRTLQVAKNMTASLVLAASKTFSLAKAVAAILLLAATATAQFVIVKTVTAFLNLVATEDDVVAFTRSVTASMNLVATKQAQITKSLTANLNLSANKTFVLTKVLTAVLLLTAAVTNTAAFIVSATATLLLAATLTAGFVFQRTVTAVLNLAADVTALYVPFVAGVTTAFGRFKGMIANLGSFMRR